MAPPQSGGNLAATVGGVPPVDYGAELVAAVDGMQDTLNHILDAVVVLKGYGKGMVNIVNHLLDALADMKGQGKGVGKGDFGKGKGKGVAPSAPPALRLRSRSPK